MRVRRCHGGQVSAGADCTTHSGHLGMSDVTSCGCMLIPISTMLGWVLILPKTSHLIQKCESAESCWTQSPWITVVNYMTHMSDRSLYHPVTNPGMEMHRRLLALELTSQAVLWKGDDVHMSYHTLQSLCVGVLLRRGHLSSSQGNGKT